MATIDDLPLSILEIIIQTVEQIEGWRNAAALQLVSKSWRTAYGNYPAKLAFTLRQGAPSGVQQLCERLPSMRELTVYTPHGNVFMNSISKCCHLTKLDVYADCDSDDFIDGTRENVYHGGLYLGCLPASLKQLRLNKVSLGAYSCEGLSCIHLTKLDFYPLIASTAALCGLLVQLKELKALTLGEFAGGGSTMELRLLEDSLKCLPCLELLGIEGSWLRSPFAVQQILPGLQQLQLVDTKIFKEWLTTLSSLASRVTKLEMKGCWLDEDIQSWERDDLLTSIPTLQKLHLNQGDDFLRLGGSALQSLSFRVSSASFTQNQMQPLASFRALTKLELEGINWMVKSSPLKDLPLKVLILIDCQSVVSQFIKPKLFPALTQLHIEEAIPQRHITLKYRLQMQTLGSILLSMPLLHQISGNSRIFTVGMSESLKAWHCESFSLKAMKIESKNAKRRANENLKLWRRPSQ